MMNEKSKKKNISGEQASYPKQNCIAGNLSKGEIPGLSPHRIIWTILEAERRWTQIIDQRKLMTKITSRRWRWPIICVKKRRKKRTYPHRIYCRHIDTKTRRSHRKAWMKTDYSHQLEYWQHEDQQNGINQQPKIGRKKSMDVLSD